MRWRPGTGEPYAAAYGWGEPDRPGGADARARAEQDRVAEHARLVHLVRGIVTAIDATRRDDARLATYADMLLARAAPTEPDRVVACVESLLRGSLARDGRGGRRRADLEGLVDRTLGAPHRPTLAAVLDERPVRDLASGLGLLALLTASPPIKADAVVEEVADSVADETTSGRDPGD